MLLIFFNSSIDSEHSNELITETTALSHQEESFIQKQSAEHFKTSKETQQSSSCSLRSNSNSLNVHPSISHRLQTVSREYQRQSMRRPRSNTAASVKDDNAVTETNVPYHTIIIDCAPITFVDSMGTRALYQV